MEDASVPTLDMQSVKGAQRRYSFTVPLATRRKRKEKLWAKRQEERLCSLRAAAAERDTIVKHKTNTITAVEFKKYLNEAYKSNKGGSSALSKLQTGLWPPVYASQRSRRRKLMPQRKRKTQMVTPRRHRSSSSCG
eukprot:575897-Prymnesium_polylepis.1